MADSIGRQAGSAVRWQSTILIFQAISYLGAGIVLARLLPPRDFGVVGLAAIFTEFVTLFSELGVGAAIIQRPKLTDAHLRVGFTLSALTGTLAAVLLFMAAPVLTDGLSARILRVLSISLFLSGLGTVSGALLLRRMDFRRAFFVELGAYLGFFLVTVAFALSGHGPWSLVAGILAQVLL
ncbi:MAG: oligosaccharide flippase family protein, partial [Terriglobales bacterium]